MKNIKILNAQKTEDDLFEAIQLFGLVV